MAKAPETLTEEQMEERTNAHPMAVPFLWLGRETTIKNFMWFPIAGMVICIALGLIYPPHHKAPWDKFFGSWAAIGFVAYSFVVLSAGPLFKLLARDEDYYGEGGLPDPEYSTEASHHKESHGGDHHD